MASFQWNPAVYQSIVNGPVLNNLVQRAIRVEAAAKINASGRPGPNVQTGRLRDSITWVPVPVNANPTGVHGPYVDIGTNVHYACIFNAYTNIRTDKGTRTIGQIQPGERVMTQTGEFHTVLAKTAFSALEKPDLVDIVADWRYGSKHKITLTRDHQILIHRDGRNMWIEASDLHDGDMMFDRIKIPENKGKGKGYPVRTCENCGNQYRNQGKRYCTRKCRDEAWAKGMNPHIGTKRSKETRELLSRIMKERGHGKALNKQLAQMGFRTSCDAKVEDWLRERGVAFERQVPIGDYVVDFFLPESREIIEADGGYWHRDQNKDIERDKDLLRELPGVEITHIHFYDKNRPPFDGIDPEPVPGARYVVCNPGPKSYVDPCTFRMTPARIVREWTYKASTKPKASSRALLYDLTVDAVHSFLANGVIVSNSFVEGGHNVVHGGRIVGYAPPRPFLRPALEAARTT